MAELSRFYGIIIAIYFRGEIGRHNMPHVHVDGRVLAGELPGTALRLVRQWLRLHADEVAAEWNAARRGQRVHRIEPLP